MMTKSISDTLLDDSETIANWEREQYANTLPVEALLTKWRLTLPGLAE